MSATGLAQISVFALFIGLLARPLGGYLARVYSGERTLLQPLLGPLERGLYRLAGVDPAVEQKWSEYAVTVLLFNAIGIGATYLLLRGQELLTLNPQGFPGLSPDLAFDTAIVSSQIRAGNPIWAKPPFPISADDRDYGSELSVRSGRDGRCYGVHPRLCPPHHRRDRQFLGGPHARHALCAASDLHHRGAVFCLGGCTANVGRFHPGGNLGRGKAADRARPGRKPGGDQTIQWRWWRVF
jgi:hypothetical protein